MQALNDPASLGFDPERLKHIDSWMQRYVDEGKFPGSSVLVARQGKIAHLATAGWRSIENKLPFELDTIARVYSMTKPITSVAVMMLTERGLFHLDAPISRFLPEFSECQALVEGAASLDQTQPCPAPTIHQLLVHTSGLTYSFNEGPLADAYLEQKADFNNNAGGLDAAVAKVAKLPLAFQPGARWEYSVSIDILGRLVEVVSGKSLQRFFHEEILDPLGMADTAFSIPSSKLERFASCYFHTEKDPLHLVDEPATTQYLDDKVDTFSGGGGLVSTLADYFRFAEMLRLGGALDGERLLSPRTVAFMRRNHLKGDIASLGPKSFAEMPMDGVGFGIGGSVVLDPGRMRAPGSVGDYSWGGMASTIFWTDPVEQLTVIFFTQLIPSSTYANRPELKALVHAALLD